MEQTTVDTTATTQTVIPSIVPDQIQAQTPAVNLIDKVSQFKKTQAAAKPATSTDNTFFDYKEIEKITDPTARQFAENAYKSMQSGFTRKTQEIAEQKRSYEQKIQEMQNWSPERIQRELNNPEFVKSAQMYAQTQNPPNSGLTEEQFSALTPQEKAELAQVPTLKNEINQLKQVNYQAVVAQRDNQLQTKYSDYNPTQIDNTIRQLSEMNPLDIREHVYKSLKHDEDVAAAYELGRQEARELTQNKINAITPNGQMSSIADDGPVREKNDTDHMYFMKRANWRLAQSKNRK